METPLSVPTCRKGTTNGTTTDVEGNFSINAKSGSTLVITFIGYVREEVKANAGRRMEIILQEDSETLEEVVVVGYGTMKKADLTGSVATVGSEVIEDRPLTNLGAGLQGRNRQLEYHFFQRCAGNRFFLQYSWYDKLIRRRSAGTGGR